ncbi:MAG: gamma-glutamylcyclotransferase [Rhodobacteraceae bacterium]|nr:gamma-glutamylcyclotransferase [Paracoccaceae bacterium]
MKSYFFGYGSLVNRATHGYSDTDKAELTGWRRTWVQTTLRPVAILTAIPAPGCKIKGLIAYVPGSDWDMLDQREWGYDRLLVTGAVRHDLVNPARIAVYAIPVRSKTAVDTQYPILMSYLDVIVQGYLHEFGIDGVRHFLDTTTGWDVPILNDRSAPQYPRAQSLTRQEIAIVDRALGDLSATVTEPCQP